MSRFLFATYPSPGHVNPAALVVEELTVRGHDVRWYTGHRFAGAVAGSNARFCAMPETLDWDYKDLSAAFPRRAELKGLKQNQFDLVEIFVRPLGEHVPALITLLADEPADVFVSHTAFYGGGWLHELGGPPNATLGDTCLMFPSQDAAPFGMGLAPGSGWAGHLRNRALNAVTRATFLFSGHEGGARRSSRTRSCSSGDTRPRVRTVPVLAHSALSARVRVPASGPSSPRQLRGRPATADASGVCSAAVVAQVVRVDTGRPRHAGDHRH